MSKSIDFLLVISKIKSPIYRRSPQQEGTLSSSLLLLLLPRSEALGARYPLDTARYRRPQVALSTRLAR